MNADSCRVDIVLPKEVELRAFSHQSSPALSHVVVHRSHSVCDEILCVPSLVSLRLAGEGSGRAMSVGEAAEGLMKKAEKLLRPSMLSMRLKPAWDDAMPLFEKAALQFKVQLHLILCRW